MKVKFTKMHGLGNDFVIIDLAQQQINLLTTEQIKFIANRHYGIGCDQVLLLESPQAQAVAESFSYQIFNADGSKAEQCGNGVRCLAKFICDAAPTNGRNLVIGTAARKLSVNFISDYEITVDMGKPTFIPAAIPFLASKQDLRYALTLPVAGVVTIGVVSFGNPHAVLQVPTASGAEVQVIGAEISQHANFPCAANVNFMEIVDRARIKLRTYERGVGETLACGSGACAAVSIGKLWGLLDSKVVVELAGGNLLIEWGGLDSSLIMTGPAARVFDGEIEL